MSSCGCETNEHTGELLCEEYRRDCEELLQNLETVYLNEVQTPDAVKAEVESFFLEQFNEAFGKLCREKALLFLGALTIRYESLLRNEQEGLTKLIDASLQKVLGLELKDVLVL